MELDQQKESEAEQLSGTRDVSQHQALKQKKGKEVGRRELESKPGAEEETEVVDCRPEDGGEARPGDEG